MINLSELFEFLQDNKLTIVPICGRCSGKCYLDCTDQFCGHVPQAYRNEYDDHICLPGPCPQCKLENVLIHVLRGFSNVENKLKQLEKEFGGTK